MSDIDVQSDQTGEEVPDPQPEEESVGPIKPDYGKVILIKDGAKATTEQLEEADIVIEETVQEMIVKNRNGVTGTVASPELIEQAEVIE